MKLSTEIRRLATAYGNTLTPLRQEIEQAVAAGQVAVKRCDLGSLLEHWAGRVEVLERESAALHQLAAAAQIVVITPPPSNDGQRARLPDEPAAASSPPWGWGADA